MRSLSYSSSHVVFRCHRVNALDAHAADRHMSAKDEAILIPDYGFAIRARLAFIRSHQSRVRKGDDTHAHQCARARVGVRTAVCAI